MKPCLGMTDGKLAGATEAPPGRGEARLAESIASSEGASWITALALEPKRTAPPPASRPARRPRRQGFSPSRTLASLLADPRRLRAAFAHVEHHSDAPGEDGLTPSAARTILDHLVASLSAQLTAGTYRSGRLLGLLMPKRDGGVRPLAVPTVRDRVAQRAACELLAPAIDTLLEGCSYAYRKGRSRTGAAVAIQQAYDEGYRYVLDADIEAFFDAVDWERLFIKLEAFFPNEPLVGLLHGWVTAPVVFSGRAIERTRGLPQGSAVSPLLANLVLDELDERLLSRNFRLVRYADDLLVLCREPEQARSAQEEVHAALADLGLSLNLEKTQVRSFAQGFSYLGYLFCRSLVLEPDHGPDASLPGELHVPAASWLAAVPLAEVRALMNHQAPSTPHPKESELAPIIDPSGPLRRPVYVADPEAAITLRGEQLIVDGPTAGHQTLAIHVVSHVVLLGHVRATVPLLLALARATVPVFFCRRTGELIAEFGPHAPDWPVWEQQAAKASDPATVLAFSRAVVQAKLHNTATLAVRLKLEGADAIADDIRELERQCLEQSEVAAVRGFEGRGAALFFGCLQASLDPAWAFTGRKKHPAPDPVNAMLSFAYTIVYNHISTAIYAAGLHPRIALFHERRGTYHALACDLQEELRYLADAHVIGMIHRNEIASADFALPEGEGQPCLLAPEARRRFVQAFERRLLTEFTPPGDTDPISYLAFIDRQTQRFKAFVAGGPAYEPLRVHA